MTELEELRAGVERLRNPYLCMDRALTYPLADWVEAVADKEEALRSPTNEDVLAFDLHPFGYEFALEIARFFNSPGEAKAREPR